MADTPPPLRVGILGCGGIARLAHLPSLARIPESRVVALADSDAARLSVASERCPEARTFADFTDVLEMPEVDAVIIALPPALHAPAAIAAIGRGKHVYIEKPLATSTADARRVLDAWTGAADSGTALTAMMGFNYRHSPVVQHARALVLSGRIGTPVAARTVFSTSARDEPEWKRTRDGGGGVLLDLAVHHIDLLRFLLSADVIEVSAVLRSLRTENDTAFVDLRLTSGCTAQCFFSLGTAEADRIELHGTAGTLTFDRYRSLGVEVTPLAAEGALGYSVRRLAREWSALPYAIRRGREPLHEPSFVAALRTFVRAARRGAGAEPDVRDGYRALAVVEAAELAAASGRSVSIPAVPSGDGAR